MTVYDYHSVAGASPNSETSATTTTTVRGMFICVRASYAYVIVNVKSYTRQCL